MSFGKFDMFSTFFSVYEESYFATVYEIEKNECLKYMNVSNCEEMQGIEPK